MIFIFMCDLINYEIPLLEADNKWNLLNKWLGKQKQLSI